MITSLAFPCYWALSRVAHKITFQYKIIRRITSTANYLNKIKVRNCKLCRLCRQKTETIDHLFAECCKVTDLYKNIENWINLKLNLKVEINRMMKILGHVLQDLNFWPLNFILLVTRYYIFEQAVNEKPLNIYRLQNIIKYKYLEQECLSVCNSTSTAFRKSWHMWKSLFQDI